MLPGWNPAVDDVDPVSNAIDFAEAGQAARARKALERLLAKDARCLAAHANLGTLLFPTDARSALRHYERGVSIADLSIGPSFAGVLPWGVLNNRPFHRWLHGLGLCLWRVERFEEAEIVFERMLWLNPPDNLGARFLLPKIRLRHEWSESDD